MALDRPLDHRGDAAILCLGEGYQPCIQVGIYSHATKFLRHRITSLHIPPLGPKLYNIVIASGLA